MTPNAGNLLLEALGSPVCPDAGAQAPPNAERPDGRFAGLIRELLADVPQAETGGVRAGQQASGESERQGEEQICDNAQLASLLGSSGSQQILVPIVTAGNIPALPPVVGETVASDIPVLPPVVGETVASDAPVLPPAVGETVASDAPVLPPAVGETVTSDTPVLPPAVGETVTNDAPVLPPAVGETVAESPKRIGTAATLHPDPAAVAPNPAPAAIDTGLDRPLPQVTGEPDLKTEQAPLQTKQDNEAPPSADPLSIRREWSPRTAASLPDLPTSSSVDQDVDTATPTAEEEPPAWTSLLRGQERPQSPTVDATAQPRSPLAWGTDRSGEKPETTPAPREPSWIALTKRPDWVNVLTAAQGRPVAAATQVGAWLPDDAGSATATPTQAAPVILDDVERVAAPDSGKRSSGSSNQGRFEPLLSDPGLTTARNAEIAASPAHLHPAREVGTRVINQIVRAAKTRLFDGGAEMTLRLDPPHLGSVHMSVTAAEGTVTAVLQTSTESARQILQADIAVLKETLARSGIKVDAIDVSVGTGPDQGWDLQGRHGEHGYEQRNAPWRLPADDTYDDPETANAGANPRRSGYGFDYLA